MWPSLVNLGIASLQQPWLSTANCFAITNLPCRGAEELASGARSGQPRLHLASTPRSSHNPPAESSLADADHRNCANRWICLS